MNESSEYKRITRQVLANARSRAKYWGVESTLTLEELREIFHQPMCFYCDGELALSERKIGFLRPLHEGGAVETPNILVSCKGCLDKIGWNSVFYRIEG